MKQEPYVHQLYLGKVKHLGRPDAEEPMNREWTTGMFKDSTSEKVYLSKTGLVGDEVGDTKHHGGEEKALFVYPIVHYTYWNEVENIAMGYGGMGENLAVLEMDEYSVFIGDTYLYGDAVIQVSQPRQPCWRPARRYRDEELALKIQDSGRTGWYFRVLEEGYVSAKSDLKLLERPFPEWSIAACNETLHVNKDDLRAADDLSRCRLLAPSWRKNLKDRLKGQESPIELRVYGPNKE